MNFYKLNKLMNEMAPPAVGLQQPMTTNPANVAPGQNTQQHQPGPDANLKQDMKKNLAKISTSLGEKGNKYQKLIQFVGRNPEMLTLLDELLGDVGDMRGTTFQAKYN
jgi:hypothetical protein